MSEYDCKVFDECNSGTQLRGGLEIRVTDSNPSLRFQTFYLQP